MATTNGKHKEDDARRIRIDAVKADIEELQGWVETMETQRDVSTSEAVIACYDRAALLMRRAAEEMVTVLGYEVMGADDAEK